MSYDFDLLVIGGGSGGLACAKEAAKLGAKVGLYDYVKPSPRGTTWGLGGTCVNVGCMPKKMCHFAALRKREIEEAECYGWHVKRPETHDWNALIQKVQDRVRSSNFGYKINLRDNKVAYFKEFAEIKDPHTITSKNDAGETFTRTASKILIAVGGRPSYPDDVEGAKEFGITSDDIFSLKYPPGKTLVVGASYIALETAGFLSSLGFDVTVMVRSIILRGFDQQMAELVAGYMKERENVKFLRGFVPTSIKSKGKDKAPPTLLVKYEATKSSDKVFTDTFNTVLFAVGRHPVTAGMGIVQLGVQIDPSTSKIITNNADETNVAGIYAIGDCVLNRPELTPAAIQAGTLLAQRLFGNGTTLTDYENCPTTIFTPFEYGCVGMSEEYAREKYGDSDIEVYHSFFQPFEGAMPELDLNKGYVKLVCVKSLKERVVGLHYLGPNAGEVTQGYALAMKFKPTKSDFNSMIGIHPTSSENFSIILSITKSSGKDPMKRGCCG